ncbi:uroporphyrin-III C-methyltransferase/precorrin-2 dehydrogenase/sirohydrochlorin ferrochelatase [Nakamurella flavida]|uniref:uroporphyrinogen-III C-methyltransferase n=1 Tax=Nakamurella flavida TaxID=363630 RepID=UPI0027860B84|nr:uroporphyrinogen-III C-methyltransferase [Nakamurella flavida]MDP9776643.1 uroporphyrin-III C-methyltransferase/precorrin-2 dehydrogenase/sirohydrochlorin ferrochelatase [Nakamurella flavida]
MSYPLHLDLAGRPVVVVGGGPVAARRAAGLVAAGALVTVVAPYACEDVVAAADAGDLVWHEREYLAGDLDGMWLAVTATGDPATDEAVERAADAQRTFCVRSDRADRGSAATPAVLRRPGVTVSIGSGPIGGPGDSASAGRQVDPRRTRAVRDALALALDSGAVPLRRHRPGVGRVVVVGGGPGDPDLMTVRARRELAAADVVVHDRLSPVSVLAELGPAVHVIDVGKTPGRHPVPQAEINALLVEHAQLGRQVVRLKGGDPFVFGRGAEEVDACRRAGVQVEVVPGVSSALAVPAAAGIPVTHRGLARQVTILTGHDVDGYADADWAHLARSAGTLVVLMGVGALPGIAGELVAHGRDRHTPVAVVERGCTPEQRTTVGTLADIGDLVRARGVRSPAVIVIGPVVALADPAVIAATAEMPPLTGR